MSNEKFWYGLIALGFIAVFSYVCVTGVKIGCDGPPLKDPGLIIGPPCPQLEPTPEPEKVIVYQTITREVYQPIIGLETVKILILLPIPVSIVVIGTVLAVKALWGARWC